MPHYLLEPAIETYGELEPKERSGALKKWCAKI